METKRRAWVAAGVAATFSLAAGALAADPAGEAKSAGSPTEALTGGKLLLHLRPRYEYVDQDGKQEVAHALTHRTLLGWETLPYQGFSFRAEAINVLHLGEERFHDQPVASPRYPTVADPETTDFHQLYADYTGLPQTRIRAGRMSLKLDNVRFVGNVEFRQILQVFNGVMLDNRSLPGVELQYAHFMRVKNVYDLQRQTRTDLFRAAWTFQPDNVLVAFGYFQDQPNTGQATGFADNSNRILGLRANGALPVTAAYKVLYTAEYAKQDAYAGGNPNIDARYWRAGIGVQRDKTFVRIDHEHLGSNRGVYAFQTPLGTNHLFQGWADLFLTTPREGIRDTFVSAGTAVMGVQVYTELHDFRSDVGSRHYGTEWDLGLTRAFTRQFTGKIEFAAFREADVLATRIRDTTRLWVTGIYNY